MKVYLDVHKEKGVRYIENAFGTGAIIQYHFSNGGQFIDWPLGYFY